MARRNEPDNTDARAAETKPSAANEPASPQPGAQQPTPQHAPAPAQPTTQSPMSTEKPHVYRTDLGESLPPQKKPGES